MIPKPGKPINDIKSYKPISLLPVMSKVAEKVIANRLQKVVSEEELVPNYQFGFRSKHSTIEQVHRVVDVIQKAFQQKSYCNAAFLDVS